MCAHAQLCLILYDPHLLKPTRLLCPWNFPGKNTGVDFYALLQGIFLTQGSNQHLLSLLHWQADPLPAEPQGLGVFKKASLPSIKKLSRLFVHPCTASLIPRLVRLSQHHLIAWTVPCFIYYKDSHDYTGLSSFCPKPICPPSFLVSPHGASILLISTTQRLASFSTPPSQGRQNHVPAPPKLSYKANGSSGCRWKLRLLSS